MGGIYRAPGSSDDASINPDLYSVYTRDWDVSANGTPTILQRGLYTLTGGVASVYLPTPLISAASGANITFFILSQTTNPAYFNGIISAQTFGSVLISSVSGFGVSGSGTDKGFWMAAGYH